jgi:preprotein translocase SecE subunit
MEKNFIVQYFHDSFQELGKVVWPTRNRAINICILVVSFVLVAAAAVAAIDFVFHTGMIYITSLKN